MNYMKKLRRAGVATMLFAIVCVVSGCGKKKDTFSGGELGYYVPPGQTTEAPTEASRYNKTDQAVVVNINTTESSITVRSITTKEAYKVLYSGGTTMVAKSGNAMTISQLPIGQVVDLYYVDGSQKLIKLQVSDDAWENTMGQNLLVDSDEKIITFAGEKYSYDDNIAVLSGNAFIGVDEIIESDEVTIRGFGKKIVSIVVDRGHGFLVLKDTADFEGGVVEIGSYITKVIESGMVIAVPEGTYKFAVSNKGIGGEGEITVGRNDTIPVSLLKYKNTIDRYGLVRFIINPNTAKLVIDGKEVDYTKEIELSYGTHKFSVTADNYAEYTGSFTVDSTYTTIGVDMVEGATEEDDEVVEETTVVDSDHKIYIYCETEGVNVYFDGIYKGSAPVSFEKVTGTHVVILMKTGYATKIYTIDIEDDNKNYIKMFDALEKE